MPDRIETSMTKPMSFNADHNDNTIQIGTEISVETAIEKIGEEYGLELKNVQPVPLTPVKGALGLFKWNNNLEEVTG
jgi:hypothetical protein